MSYSGPTRDIRPLKVFVDRASYERPIRSASSGHGADGATEQAG